MLTQVSPDESVEALPARVERGDLSLGWRLQAVWPFKLLLVIVLTGGFCIPYLFLGHHAFFPVHQVLQTPLDHWAKFDPRWVGVYQSIYLLIGFLPGIATTRAQLLRYAGAFVLLTALSLPIYFFFPTQIDRPITTGGSGLYKMLLAYDGPYNAFPSLHAGFLYLTLAFALRVYGRPPIAVSAGILVWSTLILWSTLTTKEHHAIDLLAGILLAAICDRVAWRDVRRRISPGSQTSPA